MQTYTKKTPFESKTMPRNSVVPADEARVRKAVQSEAPAPKSKKGFRKFIKQ